MSGLGFRRFRTVDPGDFSRRRCILGITHAKGKRIQALKPGSKSFCIK